MKNFITLLFLITLLPHHIYSMKRAAPDELTTSEETKKTCVITQPVQPFLPIEVIKKVLLDSFKPQFGAVLRAETQNKITTFCLVNKELSAYIHHPHNICTIMNNATMWEPSFKRVIALGIGSPAMCNYLIQTFALHDQIDDLSITDIKKLVINNGADVNYYYTDKPPLLLKTIDNYDKTACLMELGADPYLKDSTNDYNCCAFTRAIKEEKIDIVNLFIKHYPCYHDDSESSVDIAFDTKNRELIKSVLKQKNIPYDKLRRVWLYAYNEDIADLLEFLCEQEICMTCPTSYCPSLKQYLYKNPYNSL